MHRATSSRRTLKARREVRRNWSIETLSYSPTRIVRLGSEKVAILFPPVEPGSAWQLYPHPDTFPGLNFDGLPEPLRPEFLAFPDLPEVERFLGIREEEPAALAA
ncbi:MULTISPECIES: hypothetical protein [Methylobacterium]|jgi:hypothetical protein|uniref:Uncharacterized protein n=1 Tax=Methylobacterium longum TaxID=767694 RepID=A0ABT8AJ62_9HYPH|nr:MULTISPECIES: hypothetical protein [Methylobacterium]MCJ2101429.1 hypothetical protein [Methylobacterium sp. E-046]MDN3569742.1 hypothetical protein [Methylobacterium longum]GJE11777.1 hypothetical protein FOHLNKBM_2821 [Methylobacterium longum]